MGTDVDVISNLLALQPGWVLSTCPSNRFLTRHFRETTTKNPLKGKGLYPLSLQILPKCLPGSQTV